MVDVVEYAKITGLKACVGGFFEGSYTVDIDLATHQVSWCHWEDGEEKGNFHKTLRASTAQEFIEELKRLNMLNWKEHYVDPYVLDGTQWSVEIVQEGRTIEKDGSNEFPDEWDQFCNLISGISGKEFS